MSPVPTKLDRPSTAIPPPASAAMLFETVRSVNAILLSPSVAIPPPSAPEVLPETVVPVIVTEPRKPTLSGSPSVAMPPPDEAAVLPEIVPPVIVSVPPAEKTPPPLRRPSRCP